MRSFVCRLLGHRIAREERAQEWGGMDKAMLMERTICTFCGAGLSGWIVVPEEKH